MDTLRVIQYLSGPGGNRQIASQLIGSAKEGNSINRVKWPTLTIELEPAPLVLLHLLYRWPRIRVRR